MQLYLSAKNRYQSILVNNNSCNFYDNRDIYDANAFYNCADKKTDTIYDALLSMRE